MITKIIMALICSVIICCNNVGYYVKNRVACGSWCRRAHGEGVSLYPASLLLRREISDPCRLLGGGWELVSYGLSDHYPILPGKSFHGCFCRSIQQLRDRKLVSPTTISGSKTRREAHTQSI